MANPETRVAYDKAGQMRIILLLAWFFVAAHNPVYAETASKIFTSGSYQKLLASKKNQPLLLIIWSLDCASCLKEMPLIAKLHRQYPDLNMVLLSVDGSENRQQVQQMLVKTQLQNAQNWLFADANSRKLRFEIDPDWFGELPRNYFFAADHQRFGISGVISERQYRQMLLASGIIAKIKGEP